LSSRRRWFADAKLFSGGIRYGVVRKGHRLQKYSTPTRLSDAYPSARQSKSLSVRRPPAALYLFSR